MTNLEIENILYYF